MTNNKQFEATSIILYFVAKYLSSKVKSIPERFAYYMFSSIIMMLLSVMAPYASATDKLYGHGKSCDNDMFDIIISRIQQENEQNVIAFDLDTAVKTTLNLFTGAGNFYDINYSSQRRANWEPINHVTRLYNFAVAYTLPASSYYRSEELFDKIIAGLLYWDGQPPSPNWWHNEIGEPQTMGMLLIQLRKGQLKIPEELEAKMLARMRKYAGKPARQTGANKTDIALQWFYRAILTRDTSLLEEAVKHAYDPIRLTEGEGIQFDYSYFQHGKQLYIVGYGSEFIRGVTLFAHYTAGTQYTLSGEKLDIFSKFMRESFFTVIRGQYPLFTVGGRGILSRERESFKKKFALYAQRMRLIDSKNSATYDEAIRRLTGEQDASYGITANHVYYPIGEYTIHTRPNYVFDVRLASMRTGRIEWGNEENLKTYYASDGSTNIVCTGDEYDGIFPVWNWNRIPGITCVQNPDIPMPSNQWCIYGTSGFAGGVSDNQYGLTAYAYDTGYTGNSAKKAWFFFDDEVVCMGSGITATGNNTTIWDINTTVNQCLLRGDVWVASQNGVSVLSGGEYSYSVAPDWVLHNGVGYVFPSGGIIGIGNQSQSGNWYDINRSQTDRKITKDVFSLWLNHGKKPVNAGYAYTVVFDRNTVKEMEQYWQNNMVEILINTDSIQAIYHKGLDILGLVFYTAGIFEYNGMSVQTDNACVIMFRGTAKTKTTMYIADPTHTLLQGTVRTRLHGKADTIIVCDFTENAFAGMSKAYVIE